MSRETNFNMVSCSNEQKVNNMSAGFHAFNVVAQSIPKSSARFSDTDPRRAVAQSSQIESDRGWMRKSS